MILEQLNMLDSISDRESYTYRITVKPQTLPIIETNKTAN